MPPAPPTAQPILVVGAGITGLSAAWLLRRAGYTVEVRDAAPEAGGLLAPIEFRGLPCDKGSHRIHPQAHPLLLELTKGANWERKDRRGVLVLGGQHMAYPLQLADFLKGLGVKTAAHMGANFLFKPGARKGFRQWEADRSDVDDDIGFENFVVSRVGQRAYAQFYAPYVEKVWGLAPSEISQTVAKARVSTASPLTTLKKALRPKPTDDASFLYPRGGMAELVDFFLTGLWASDVTIQFDSPVDAETIKDWPGPVFYSGHLSGLAPDCGLDHRGLYLLHIAVPKNTVGQTDTFYLPESQFLFGRVSQPARFSVDFDTDEVDVLCAEIPQGRHGTDEDFTARSETINAQLTEAGIVPPNTPIVDIHQTFIPRVYPLYTRDWLARWRRALKTVETLGEVFPIGRQGLFLHCNVDQCVHIADEAVSHLLQGRDSPSWLSTVDRFLELRVRD